LSDSEFLWPPSYTPYKATGEKCSKGKDSEEREISDCGLLSPLKNPYRSVTQEVYCN